MPGNEGLITFRFTEELPSGFHKAAVIISGHESFGLPYTEYLLPNDTDRNDVFEIRYLTSCSPYKESLIFEGFLAAGHHSFFYLYDLAYGHNVMRLKVNGYFGHLYVKDNKLYVADAGGIYCIDTDGKIIWQNKNLGVDGVLIFQIEDNLIRGSGQWDPPDGWIDFTLSKENGELVK